MSNTFYRAFEDEHRGSRDVIKARLRAYEPFLLPLRAALAAPTALDLGCGRGEWLELLTEHGFDARGVDLDEGMLAACRERGLQVQTQDALGSLRAQPDASLAVISAFHLVEHIPFDDVQELIAESLRALQPGGLLIMETPNPENLVVATSGFYMDPSHLRPIPPMLLEFVVGFAGFPRHKVLRLQEPEALHGPVTLEPINFLNGVSPDFSVVAQKTGPEALLAGFDQAFAMRFGIELADLSSRYHQQQHDARTAIEAEVLRLDERVAAIEGGAASVIDRALSMVAQANESMRSAQLDLSIALQRERSMADWSRRIEQQNVTLSTEVAERKHQLAQALAVQSLGEEQSKQLQHALGLAEERAAQADEAMKLVQQAQEMQRQLEHAMAQVAAAEHSVSVVYASTSWKLTSPVRFASRVVGRLVRGLRLGGLRSRTSGVLRRMAARIVRKMMGHGRLARWGMGFLASRPGLKARLRRLVGTASSPSEQSWRGSAASASVGGAGDMTPRAARLLADLKKSAAEKEH